MKAKILLKMTRILRKEKMFIGSLFILSSVSMCLSFGASDMTFFFLSMNLCRSVRIPFGGEENLVSWNWISLELRLIFIEVHRNQVLHFGQDPFHL
jgi:hypothetical protein